MALPAVENWQGEHLRVTFFAKPESLDPKSDVWKALVGREPEFVGQKPSEGVISTEGAFSEGRLIVNTMAGRVDILYVPAAIRQYPSIGAIRTALDELLLVVKENLGLFTDTVRVAVGGAATFRTKDREEGYQILAELVPSLTFDEHVRDVSVQLNYPCDSSTKPGLVVNRLGRWFAGTVNVFAVGEVSGPRELGHMVRSEFDVNSVGVSAVEFGRDELTVLLDEFAGYSVSLVSEGSRP